ADVDRFALAVREQIHAGLLRQTANLLLQILNGHVLLSPRSSGQRKLLRFMTFTGAIGAFFNYPLRLIIRACVALHIHPNVLTFTGVLINVWAGVDLARGHFISAGFIMLFANIFDFIDGKVAADSGKMSKFGGFWDSVIDRLSDLALSVGLV